MLIQNADFRRKLGERGKQKVLNRFNSRVIAEQLAELFKVYTK
jgi:glycosyltransferase involved in cell wall biosynthesis